MVKKVSYVTNTIENVWYSNYWRVQLLNPSHKFKKFTKFNNVKNLNTRIYSYTKLLTTYYKYNLHMLQLYTNPAHFTHMLLYYIKIYKKVNPKYNNVVNVNIFNALKLL